MLLKKKQVAARWQKYFSSTFQNFYSPPLYFTIFNSSLHHQLPICIVHNYRLQKYNIGDSNHTLYVVSAFLNMEYVPNFINIHRFFKRLTGVYSNFFIDFICTYYISNVILEHVVKEGNTIDDSFNHYNFSLSKLN